MTCPSSFPTYHCKVVGKVYHDLLWIKSLETYDLRRVYHGLIYYRRKEPSVQQIYCPTSLPFLEVGDFCTINWDQDTSRYKHLSHIFVSNPHNCYGGFHQIPPIPIPKDDETYPAVCLLARQVPAVPKAQRPHRHPALPMAARTAHCAVQGA